MSITVQKKLSVVTVAAVLSTAAQPESNVSLYGTLDASVVAERSGAAGAVTKVTCGMASASRLSIKGKEYLGGKCDAQRGAQCAVRCELRLPDREDIFSTADSRAVLVAVREHLPGIQPSTSASATAFDSASFL